MQFANTKTGIVDIWMIEGLDFSSTHSTFSFLLSLWRSNRRRKYHFHVKHSKFIGPGKTRTWINVVPAQQSFHYITESVTKWLKEQLSTDTTVSRLIWSRPSSLFCVLASSIKPSSEPWLPLRTYHRLTIRERADTSQIKYYFQVRTSKFAGPGRTRRLAKPL